MSDIPRTSEIHRMIPIMLRRYRNLAQKTSHAAIVQRKEGWESIARKGGQWKKLTDEERDLIYEYVAEEEEGPLDRDDY